MISTSKYMSDGPMTWMETVFVFCVIRISVIGVKIREVTAKKMKSVRYMSNAFIHKIWFDQQTTDQ